MLFFIKIKLSSRLCLTHKRVTQKYRNSTLIKNNNKLRWYRIGSELAEISGSDRIGKNGIVASLIWSTLALLSSCLSVISASHSWVYPVLQLQFSRPKSMCGMYIITGWGFSSQVGGHGETLYFCKPCNYQIFMFIPEAEILKDLGNTLLKAYMYNAL